jgi:hypothetical protein
MDYCPQLVFSKFSASFEEKVDAWSFVFEKFSASDKSTLDQHKVAAKLSVL